jgi:hypothetical protein
VSRKSKAGKQAWRNRAPGYAAELRAEIEQKAAQLGPQIERDASARFARWQARGRLPLWFRVKRHVRDLIASVRVATRG